MFRGAHHLTAIAFALCLTGSVANAAPRDSESVELVATLELHAGNIAGMRLAEQQGRDLLYLQDTNKQTVTVVDVTQAAHPKMVRETALPVDDSATQKIGSVSITDGRGVTYLVDQDGLTIMRKTVTSATEIEREFDKRMLYDR
jgi:hypothetical protein